MAEAAVLEASRQLGVTLKDKQMETILGILQGRDVFAVLPTGYGKSLIYGILPKAFDIFLSKMHH
jgi:bloom syndrome protein